MCAVKPVPLEIGGDFVGQIYAYSNMVANFSSALMPPLFGALLDMGPIYQIETWYPVFLVTFFLIICGSIIFNCGTFGVLEWATRAPVDDKGNASSGSTPVQTKEESESHLTY